MYLRANKALQNDPKRSSLIRMMVTVFALLFQIATTNVNGADCKEKYSFIPMESVTLKLGDETHIIASSQNHTVFSCYVLTDETQDSVSNTIEKLVEVYYRGPLKIGCKNVCTSIQGRNSA